MKHSISKKVNELGISRKKTELRLPKFHKNETENYEFRRKKSVPPAAAAKTSLFRSHSCRSNDHTTFPGQTSDEEEKLEVPFREKSVRRSVSERFTDRHLSFSRKSKGSVVPQERKSLETPELSYLSFKSSDADDSNCPRIDSQSLEAIVSGERNDIHSSKLKQPELAKFQFDSSSVIDTKPKTMSSIPTKKPANPAASLSRNHTYTHNTAGSPVPLVIETLCSPLSEDDGLETRSPTRCCFTELLELFKDNYVVTTDIQGEKHYSFWETAALKDDTVFNDKRDVEFSSLNRMIEKVLFEIQESERLGAPIGPKSHTIKFFTSYGLLPRGKLHILLYRFLEEIYPGPPPHVKLKANYKLNLPNLSYIVLIAIDIWKKIRAHEFESKEMKTVWNNFYVSLQNPPEAAVTMDMEINKYGMSFAFLEMNLKDLARQLTVIDHKHLTKISLEEFSNNSWQKHENGQSKIKSPHILMNIVHFNNLTNWAAAMVLKGENDKEKSRIIARLSRLCRELQKLGNFNSLMAIHAALYGVIIQRMVGALNMLDHRSRYNMSKLNSLMSVEKNYFIYRRELSRLVQDGEYCVPYLGVILRDLAFLNELPNTSEQDEKLLNVSKIGFVGDCISPLLRLHRLPLMKSDEDLNSFIHVVLTPRFSYEELLNISKQQAGAPTSKELNNHAHMEMDTASLLFDIPDKFVVDYYAEQKKSHTRKHIARMVEAIFKQYDADGDGSICQEEFNGVLDSFPFLDSFSVVDADGDGQVSYDEMNNYFLISCVAEMLFKRADTDNSGALNREEYTAIQAEFPNIKYEDIDFDGDGEIDLCELRRFMLENMHLVSDICDHTIGSA